MVSHSVVNPLQEKNETQNGFSGYTVKHPESKPEDFSALIAELKK